jgi:hypothetical protein
MTYPIKLVPVEAPSTIATTHPSIPSVDVKDLPVSSLEVIVNEFRKDLYKKAGREHYLNPTSRLFHVPRNLGLPDDGMKDFHGPAPQYPPNQLTPPGTWPPGTILCGAQDAVGAITGTGQEVPISPTQTR